MIINLKLPDDLYDQYLKKFNAPKHYLRMKQAIEAFLPIGDGDRYLILHGKERQAIESEFQTNLDTPEKLLKLIKNLKSVKINGVEVNFSDDEMARLKMQADFHGRTPDQYILEMIDEIRLRMLEKV